MRTIPATAGRTIMGHPRGLVILFFTEMWERFSYYGMRALLIFYLTEHFLFGDGNAAGIFASYAALVYLMPVLGGVIADRYLGFNKAVWLGGILIMLGHFGMAFEGAEATVNSVGTVERDFLSVQMLYFSLTLIVVGTGLLKPSISSVVSNLYGEEDSRRDTGFTIFYMGINVGALAPLLCVWLAAVYGWSYGFGAAGIGMFIGLAVFKYGRHWLEGAGEPPNPEALRAPVFGPLTQYQVVVISWLLAVLPVWWLVQNGVFVGGLLGIVGLALIGLIAVYAIVKLETVERDRIFVILVLVFASALFWAFFEQTGTSIALFVKRGVDLDVLGLAIEAGQIQAINPAYIILLAPLFAWLWIYLRSKGWEPSLPVKFSLALVQLGLGFFMFVYGIESAAEGEKVGFVWLMLGFLLHTTGELCLSPVGLSAVTKLSIPRILGLMMGIWFLANAFANYLAGAIAATASIDHVPGKEVAVEQALPVYGELFASVGWYAIGAGVIMLLVAPLIRRGMHGVR